MVMMVKEEHGILMGEGKERKADLSLREGAILQQREQKQKQKNQEEGWLWRWWSRSKGFIFLQQWRGCIFCIIPITIFLFTFFAFSASFPRNTMLFIPHYTTRTDLESAPPPLTISENVSVAEEEDGLSAPSLEMVAADSPTISQNNSDKVVDLEEKRNDDDDRFAPSPEMSTAADLLTIPRNISVEENSNDGGPAPSPDTDSAADFPTISQNTTDAGVNLEEEGGDVGGSAPYSESFVSPPWMGRSVEQQCDVWNGMWVQDGEHYPLYGACPYVDSAFGCQENGRPDADYLKWRWQPRHCSLPRFDAQRMLEKLRGRRMVFAGDSLMRNQWESMLCLLREGLSNKSRMIETRSHRITKGKGDYIFKFLDYNARVEFYRSHFLVAEGKTRTDKGKQKLTLRIDTVDRTSRRWKQADVLIFTTGHWWNHGKTSKGKDYFQEGNMVYPSLPVMVAFKKAITTWASWVDKNIDPKLTKVFFSGYSPSHFHGGQWDSGGQCNDEKDPIQNESYLPSYPEKMLVIEDVIRSMKNPVQILNITRLSEYRKDAHPSIFGQVPQDGVSRRQDCSHWCLPGLPDIWNEVLYAFM